MKIQSAVLVIAVAGWMACGGDPGTDPGTGGGSATGGGTAAAGGGTAATGGGTAWAGGGTAATGGGTAATGGGTAATGGGAAATGGGTAADAGVPGDACSNQIVVTLSPADGGTGMSGWAEADTSEATPSITSGVRWCRCKDVVFGAMRCSRKPVK